MRRRLILPAAYSIALVGGACAHPYVPASRLVPESALAAIPADAPARVRTADRGTIEGRFSGYWNEAIAIRVAGEVLEVFAWDTVWVGHDRSQLFVGIVGGSLVGLGLGQFLNSVSRGDVMPGSTASLAVGAAAGALLAHRAGGGWRPVAARADVAATDSATRLRPLACCDPRRRALEQVRAGSLVRIAGPGNQRAEGVYAGIWSDSLRLAGARWGLPADSVRGLWVREGANAKAAGAGAGGLLGLLFGGFAANLAYGYQTDPTQFHAALIGSIAAGAFVGWLVGSGLERWRPVPLN